MKSKLTTLKVLTLGVMSLTPILHAHASIEQQLKECAGINTDHLRLACFDAISKNLNAPDAVAKEAKIKANTADISQVPEPKPGLKKAIANKSSTTSTTAAATVATTAAQSTANSRDDFGLEHKQAANSDVNEVTLTIVGVKKSLHGYWTLTFDNGQQWRTITSTSRSFKTEQKVTIRRGVLNSFTMALENSNRTYKVRRLK
ncbi:hypothetical protein [Thalassotalea aquiviva]|uniref:hypothetical protein n=1 Tax=Thalassotalea aquiviva TaxID=3242415 RepID=UPI00352B7B07